MRGVYRDKLSFVITDAVQSGPEKQAEIIEALVGALVTTMAFASRGDRRKADTLLDGVEGHLAGELADALEVMASVEIIKGEPNDT